MSLWDFYDYSPIEIDQLFKALNDVKSQEAQLSWEQLRIRIYYSYLFAPSNKRKVSYKTFKKDYFPLSSDEDEKEEVQVIDDEAFDYIQNYFKPKEGAQQ